MAGSTTLGRVDSFVGGGTLPPSEGLYAAKIVPRTGALMTLVAHSGPRELKRAAASVHEAFLARRDIRPRERGSLLVELSRMVRARCGELGWLQCEAVRRPVREMPRLVNEYSAGCIQMPAGIFKKSGYGREQGLHVPGEYMQLKSMIVRP